MSGDVHQRSSPLTYANVVIAKPRTLNTDRHRIDIQPTLPPPPPPPPAMAVTSRRRHTKVSLDQFNTATDLTKTIPPPPPPPLPLPPPPPPPPPASSAPSTARAVAADSARSIKVSRVKRLLRHERTLSWIRDVVLGIVDAAVRNADGNDDDDAADDNGADRCAEILRRQIRRRYERISASAYRSEAIAPLSAPICCGDRRQFLDAFACFHHGFGVNAACESAVVRAHCRQMRNALVDAATFDLLSALTEFDVRSIQRDPVKGKIRQRFVSGLKEIGKRMRSRTLRCIIVAVNVESSSSAGSLDDLLEEIVVRADDADVPVIYALTRRRLARAVRQQCRVSAVGILTSAGADELLNAALNAAKRHREEFAMLHADSLLIPDGRERLAEVDALRLERRRRIDERRAEAAKLDAIESDRRAAALAERERARIAERRERDRERNRLVQEKNAALRAERGVEESASEAVTAASPVPNAKSKAKSVAAAVDADATLLYDNAPTVPRAKKHSDARKSKSRKR